MKRGQQELPLPFWGGARKGAGRKRKASRPQVPHEPRGKFRNGALHITLRLRQEVWNLRTRRCFQALRHAFEHGCNRFRFRVIHFSVQGNHIHMIVEGPDPQTLARAMKGCSAAPHDRGPPLVVEPLWWMLRVGVERVPAVRLAA